MEEKNLSIFPGTNDGNKRMKEEIRAKKEAIGRAKIARKKRTMKAAKKVAGVALVAALTLGLAYTYAYNTTITKMEEEGKIIVLRGGGSSGGPKEQYFEVGEDGELMLDENGKPVHAEITWNDVVQHTFNNCESKGKVQ